MSPLFCSVITGRRQTRQPDELVQARRWGFITVKNNRRRIDLVNEWWRECRRSRKPYVVITVRGSKTADLRLENETMDAPYPAPASRFTVEQQSALLALIESADTYRGRGFVDQDGCVYEGLRRDEVEILAVRMLAVVTGKCWCVDRAPPLVGEDL